MNNSCSNRNVSFIFHKLHQFLHNNNIKHHTKHIRQVKAFMKELHICNKNMKYLDFYTSIYVDVLDGYIHKRLHKKHLSVLQYTKSRSKLYHYILGYYQQCMFSISLFYNTNILQENINVPVVQWNVCCVSANNTYHKNQFIFHAPKVNMDYLQYKLSLLTKTPMHQLQLTIDSIKNEIHYQVQKMNMNIHVILKDIDGNEYMSSILSIHNEQYVQTLLMSVLHMSNVRNRLYVHPALSDTLHVVVFHHLQMITQTHAKIKHTSIQDGDTLVCIIVHHTDVQNMYGKIHRWLNMARVYNEDNAYGVYEMCYRQHYDLPQTVSKLNQACNMSPLQSHIMLTCCQHIALWYRLSILDTLMHMQSWLYLHTILFTNMLWNDDAYANQPVYWNGHQARTISKSASQHRFDASMFLFYLILNFHQPSQYHSLQMIKTMQESVDGLQ